MDGKEEWKVKEILNSRLRATSHSHKKKLQYLVKWMVFPRSEASWQLAEDVANAVEEVEQFHAKYPDRLKS